MPIEIEETKHNGRPSAVYRFGDACLGFAASFAAAGFGVLLLSGSIGIDNPHSLVMFIPLGGLALMGLGAFLLPFWLFAFLIFVCSGSRRAPVGHSFLRNLFLNLPEALDFRKLTEKSESIFTVVSAAFSFSLLATLVDPYGDGLSIWLVSFYWAAFLGVFLLVPIICVRIALYTLRVYSGKPVGGLLISAALPIAMAVFLSFLR